jgi:peroxiredoxin
VVFAAVRNRLNSLFLLAAVLLGATSDGVAAGWPSFHLPSFSLPSFSAPDIHLFGPSTDPFHLLGQSAPDFALRGTSGNNFRLSEYRGDVVLLAFWGSRCGLCGAQLAALSRMVDTYRSAGLTALAVNIDDNQMAAAEYALAHPVSFPVLLDPGKKVAKQYRIDDLPMLLLVDRAGAIRFAHRNYRTGSNAQYLDQIKILLDE